jgi:hypothetical protein
MKNKMIRMFTLALFIAAALLSGQTAAPTVIDVRNGDQQGKLMFKETELAFESLTDARHSRNWKYAEIRELTKKRKEIRVRPFKGSRYDFQFKSNDERDKIYDMLSNRVVTARQAAKK